MPALVVVVGYGTAFYYLSLRLNQLPLGIAYAIWAGVGTALIALLGCVLCRRALDPGAVIGILLIVAGVGIINLSASGRRGAGIDAFADRSMRTARRASGEFRQHPHRGGRWWAIFALVRATRPTQRNTMRLLSA